MKKLNSHEDSEKRNYYEFLDRWNRNHRISYVLILFGVLLAAGVLLCWLKSSGVIFGLR